MEPARASLPARLLLSVVLAATIVAEIGFTWLGWTGEHVFSPEWHPHARFHAAQLVTFAIALSLGSMWLLWRRSAEPRVVVWAVAGSQIFLWGGELVAVLVPGTSPSPIPAMPNTFPLLGFEVVGNLFFSAALVVLSVLAGLLAGPRTGSRVPASSAST